MFIILSCTIIGFLIGLSYVMAKRRIRPGKVLSATFLALLSSALWKMINDYKNTINKKYRRYF